MRHFGGISTTRKGCKWHRLSEFNERTFSCCQHRSRHARIRLALAYVAVSIGWASACLRRKIAVAWEEEGEIRIALAWVQGGIKIVALALVTCSIGCALALLNALTRVEVGIGCAIARQRKRA